MGKFKGYNAIEDAVSNLPGGWLSDEQEEERNSRLAERSSRLGTRHSSPSRLGQYACEAAKTGAKVALSGLSAATGAVVGVGGSVLRSAGSMALDMVSEAWDRSPSWNLTPSWDQDEAGYPSDDMALVSYTSQPTHASQHTHTSQPKTYNAQEALLYILDHIPGKYAAGCDELSYAKGALEFQEIVLDHHAATQESISESSRGSTERLKVLLAALAGGIAGASGAGSVLLGLQELVKNSCDQLGHRMGRMVSPFVVSVVPVAGMFECGSHPSRSSSSLTS